MNRRQFVFSSAATALLAPQAFAQPRPLIPLGHNTDLGGIQLLPPDNPWNQDVSRAPLDPNSARILNRLGLKKALHPDFGGFWEGEPIGMQYVVVPGNQPRVPVTFTYADESDPGPYPIPVDAPIEGGPKSTGDRHVIALDRDNWVLWELFNAFPDGKGGWKADSGARWDLRQNQVRPANWTSADAAGLPILPGLVRYDEAVGKQEIRHALRFTVEKTRRAYVPPASHYASDADDEDLPPMGMRMRLKASFDLSPYRGEARAILQALKTYGMLLADNGSDMFISGGHDRRWNPDALRAIKRVTAGDFEIIQMTGLVAGRRR